MSREYAGGSPISLDDEASDTGKEQRLRADARRNRHKVIEAAHAVFSERGPEARMEEVAARAGVGVGTVYRHFPSKEVLLEAVVVERFGHLVQLMREALEEPDPWDAFAGAMQQAARTVSENLAFMRAILPFLETRERPQEVRRELEKVMMKLVERAQSAGALRSDVTVDDLPFLLGGAVLATRHKLQGNTPARRERYVQIILDGLRARP